MDSREGVPCRPEGGNPVAMKTNTRRESLILGSCFFTGMGVYPFTSVKIFISVVKIFISFLMF